VVLVSAISIQIAKSDFLSALPVSRSTGSIIATPAPAAVLLLGFGLIGLVAEKRRFETKPNSS
jgi:hypothetical protein